MARIRTIKPEFFTSETISHLSLSARLTFIGLWTYVDDNGVGLDNERLIIAAVWPLEESMLTLVSRMRDDLQSISGEGLVTRYTVSGHRFLHVTNWTENQRISHPRKARYPLPPAFPLDPPTWENDAPPIFRSVAGSAPATLRPEQGTGNREQGYTRGELAAYQ